MLTEFRVAISKCEILVRDCDLVVKSKKPQKFPGVFVGDLQKYILVKIFRYVVFVRDAIFSHCTLVHVATLAQETRIA